MSRVAMQRGTDDAAISSSGTAVIVYGANVVSGGSGGVLILRDGTSTSDTAMIQVNGTASVGVTVTFGANGIVFPNGCYADEDTNVAQWTVFFEKL